MPTNRKTPCPSCGKPHRASSLMCRACHMKARLASGGASLPLTKPAPPARVTCTCGHHMTAATWTDAWILFDQHCDAEHGRRSTAQAYYKQSSVGGQRGHARHGGGL